LHFEYNGAVVLAALITAYTDMFNMCDVYCTVYTSFGKSTIIIGDANRKIFKKEKCG
jgi:hypothetical protein